LSRKACERFGRSQFVDRRPTRHVACELVEQTLELAALGSRQAGVYGSVRHYLKAVAKAGTDDADKVADAMRTIPIEDIFSENARIREDGRVTRTMYLARVKTPSESKYPWDYFEIVRPIASEETVWPLSESKCSLVKNATR
jgi:branched-chain amino acid transport system substrate-binding protein